ncbi:hypothetical protein AAMO2058_001181100, partial [Amorphochlora amoebiformis]
SLSLKPKPKPKRKPNRKPKPKPKPKANLKPKLFVRCVCRSKGYDNCDHKVLLVHGQKRNILTLKEKVEKQLRIPCLTPSNTERALVPLHPTVSHSNHAQQTCTTNQPTYFYIFNFYIYT